MAKDGGAPELPRSRPVLKQPDRSQGSQPNTRVCECLYDFWLRSLKKALFFNDNFRSHLWQFLARSGYGAII